MPSWINFRKSLESNILIRHLLPFFIVYILYHIFLFLSRNISEIKIGHGKPAKNFYGESFSPLFFWSIQRLLNHPHSICSSGGKKFFLPLSYDYIISYFFYFVKRRLSMVARAIWPLPGPGARLACPGKNFFHFREKIDSVFGPTRPDFCFEWSRLTGGRLRTPARGPLSTKNGRIWYFFWPLRAPDPKKLRKNYENLIKI